MADPARDPSEFDFVLKPETTGIEMHRRPEYDLYARSVETRKPLVVFVHGPVRGEGARPRDWPVYRGYASLVADTGVAAAIVDLDYTDVHALDAPITQLRKLVDDVRVESAVASDRVVVWAFSGGARLVARWLEEPPDWMRGIALTYPVMPTLTHVRLPIVVTRVGLERPPIQATVDQLLTLAPAAEVVHVEGGQHGFDMLDHNEESRRAVSAALNAVVRLLV